MLFYRAETEIIDMKALQVLREDGKKSVVKVFSELKELKRSGDMHDFAHQFFYPSEKFFHKSGKSYYVFISEIRSMKVVLGLISRNSINSVEIAEKYLHFIEIKHRRVATEEITLNSFESLIRTSNQKNFIANDDKVLEYFELETLVNRHCGITFGETIIPDNISKQALIKTSNDLLCRESLAPEIERIYENSSKSMGRGHPVHYMIQTDDPIVRNKMMLALLLALHANGRIRSKRFSSISITNDNEPSWEQYETLYNISHDSAIVVEYITVDEYESGYAKANTGIIERLCATMKKHKNDALTVFCLPRSCGKIKNAFIERLDTVTIVPLTEETVFGDKAKVYLRKMASKQGVSPDKALYRAVSESEKGYLAADLNRSFDEWYSKKLKTNIYPQYATFESANRQVCKNPIGSAYLELKKMIGLAEAKAVIAQAVDYHKAQRLFKDKGMRTEHTAMHMVFTGNPGTAKTTVARLFAQIMKDNGLLSIGDLYEVGRADLVGRYVGWTAQIVKEKFRAAKGSVLFIDEAYSLVEDHGGMYGDEAINTIVQEMENRREDMVVIFAGYPDKMESFIQKNPGLRSRIAFTVPFADYNKEELYQIAELLAGTKNMTLAPDVKDKLSPIFSSAIGHEDFGNGRFARNLLEKAQMKHASRLVAMDIGDVSNEDVCTLTAEDFDIPILSPHTKRRVIGFTNT